MTSLSSPRVTRAQSVRQKLAEEIVSGVLFPGTALDESELASRFAVSRTPVREALRDLAAMGLVQTRAHRSSIVTRPDRDRLGDMFEVMADLEGLCAGRSAIHMTPSERQQLEEVHELLTSIVHMGDASRYHEVNEQFHTLIYGGGHNAYLQEITAATRDRLSPFRRVQFFSEGRLARSLGEHEKVLNAIARGEAQAAQNAMRAHILLVEDTYEKVAFDNVQAADVS